MSHLAMGQWKPSNWTKSRMFFTVGGRSIDFFFWEGGGEVFLNTCINFTEVFQGGYFENYSKMLFFSRISKIFKKTLQIPITTRQRVRRKCVSCFIHPLWCSAKNFWIKILSIVLCVIREIFYGNLFKERSVLF